MSVFELILVAVGLAMDAMAVAVCKGLSAGRANLRHALLCGLYFGGFQGGMPLLGWLLGVRFQALIQRVDHWIAFGLLSLIGYHMIRESFGDGAGDSGLFTPRAMLPLALATSIDALAVGVTFAFLQVDILLAAALIGGITALLSALGLGLGAMFGARWRGWAERLGGGILIFMAVRILYSHLVG